MDLQPSSAETPVTFRLSPSNSALNTDGDTMVKTDKHGCTYDYQTASRDAIAKANPIVRLKSSIKSEIEIPACGRRIDQEMAQKTEKEETEFKVPETLALCVNNCGFTGNPATNNMCQKCFNATTSTSNSTTAAPATTASSALGVSSGSEISSKSPRSSTSRSPVRDPLSETSQKAETSIDREKSDVALAKREVNRCSCSGCRKKVGLTGFRCRCGELFCWEHRYSDRHDCSYDYKAAGREAIARENPWSRRRRSLEFDKERKKSNLNRKLPKFHDDRYSRSDHFSFFLYEEIEMSSASERF
ncbi:hypothetical protein GH714_015889 [Hevea brasiliensis]|uniref:AN1-type domain-containing protein n=1 Tax=Hevea brasiliensis TaxID=3981 RepID=A0A6A6N203_HEVBR|nr:hypothetical protein GH714_015889 [Hevea brasiliensis]